MLTCHRRGVLQGGDILEHPYGKRLEFMGELQLVVADTLDPVTDAAQVRDDGSQPLEYGLIAEEVAQVLPELVVYDTDGQAFTVRYHLLAPMLLDALQREHAARAAQAARLDSLEKQVAALLQGR